MPTIIRETCFWIAASILALMPFVLAIDFGGVLWWSQYIASLATSVVVIVTGIGLLASGSMNQVSKQVLLVPLLLWVVFAWSQTVSLPPSVVAWLSPASVSAHTDWVEPYVRLTDSERWFTISVSVTDSCHSLALLCIVVGIAWSSAIVFDSRLRLVLLLSVLAVGAACISAIGLWLRIFPDLGFFGFEAHLSPSSFATFINRNNAALLLNLGAASSVGLLSWRLTALTGQEVDDPEFEFSDLLSLINDRESMIGIVSATLCFSGLLVGGSRGGVVAALIGVLVAFGWVRQRRGLASLPVIASVIALCVAVLLVPTDLSLESIQRLEVLASSSQTTLLTDGRLRHWPDGLRAAAAHLPFGSGLATYGDAVRPHQISSSSSGFAHADNLWVELITEQGLFGVTLALVILIAVGRALHRMSDSADPIDLGLRVTGWFALVAVVTSQAFDFGLIVPANLFAIAMLLPAIVARNVAAGTALQNRTISDEEIVLERESDRASEFRHRQLFTSRSQHVITIAIASIVGLLQIPAVSRLCADAKSDSLLRELDAELKWLRTDDRGLSLWTKRLTADVEANPLPNTFESLCELNYLQGRLVDVAEQTPQSPAEARELYERTSPLQLRLKWNRDSRISSTDSQDNRSETISRESGTSGSFYQQSLDDSSNAIRLRPLAQTPRPYQAYLDFLHRDRDRSLACLKQLAVVYAQEPSTLVKIGTLAADSGEDSLASSLWKSAITAEPSLTPQVLSQATKYDLITLSELLPQTSANYRLAATYLLNAPRQLNPSIVLSPQGDQTPDQDTSSASQLLRDCLDGLGCETCDTQAERGSCEQLAGDIAYYLREFDKSFVHYQEALTYDPMNAELRLKLVLRLKEQNQRKLALDEARKARMTIKDDPRFTQVIETMAEEDRSAIQDSVPTTTP